MVGVILLKIALGQVGTYAWKSKKNLSEIIDTFATHKGEVIWYIADIR